MIDNICNDGDNNLLSILLYFISINNKKRITIFKSAQDSRRGETPTGHKQYMDRLLIKCNKHGQMAKRRTCESKRPSSPHCKAYNYQTEETWKSNNSHEDNGRTSQASKKKEEELSVK